MLSRLSLTCFLSGLCLTAFSAQGHALEIKPEAIAPISTTDIAPHKALYEIKLQSSRSGSQIANISGQMFYEWAVDCDAWSSNHRFNLLYEYTDNAPQRITSDFSTFEAFDGSHFNYTSQRKQDGKLFEEIRGSAGLDKKGKGKATFSIPKELVYELNEGTLFPIGHTVATLEKIKQGKTFFNATIFDGSDSDGPTEVNAFIGKALEPQTIKFEETADNLDKDLLKAPAHEVRLAFFPLNNDEATSDYEMKIILHENSVISDMMIEYDDFTVSQKLIALEPVKNQCQNQSMNNDTKEE